MKKGGWGPWLYLAPALFFLVLYLVYPTINTIRLSLYSRKSDEFIGIDNYISVFTDPVMLMAIRKTKLVCYFENTWSISLRLSRYWVFCPWTRSSSWESVRVVHSSA